MNLNCSDQLNQSPSSTPHIRLNGAYTLLVRFRHLFRISFASPSAIFKKMLIPLPDSVVLVHAVAMATGPASLQTAKRQSIISQDGGYAFSIKKRGGGGWGICLLQNVLAGRVQFQRQIHAPTLSDRKLRARELYSRALRPWR